MDYWLRDRGVDGARLDVANEVDMRFWRAMRTHLKAARPEAYILGEEWGDASAWLGGDQWDASMNYAFREAALGFFATKKSSPSDLGRSLMTNVARYAPQVNRAMMNLLGSHDTARFLTLCKGDADMARLAAALQFTWIGMPSIYYGDELGMEGGPDPQNRRGMRWDLATAANPFLARYRKLIAIRRSSAALQSGDPRVLLTDDAAG
ncbi:MAG: alpha-glycosidase, partial [Armatimonadota bacterium]